MYVGTAAGLQRAAPDLRAGLHDGHRLASSMYSSATQDCANKFAVARQIYGFPFTQPFPDSTACSCLVIVGANPVVSKWSFLQVLESRRGACGRSRRAAASVFVVDPRRTETAKVAGEHVFIRPGTDVFFFLSFLHELIATGGVDRRARRARS